MRMEKGKDHASITYESGSSPLGLKLVLQGYLRELSRSSPSVPKGIEYCMKRTRRSSLQAHRVSLRSSEDSE
jgi:hypothetical protein